MKGEHVHPCPTPEVTRRWRRLGVGAVWLCECGQMHRLRTDGAGDYYWWKWEKVP